MFLVIHTNGFDTIYKVADSLPYVAGYVGVTEDEISLGLKVAPVFLVKRDASSDTIVQLDTHDVRIYPVTRDERSETDYENFSKADHLTA